MNFFVKLRKKGGVFVHRPRLMTWQAYLTWQAGPKQPADVAMAVTWRAGPPRRYDVALRPRGRTRVAGCHRKGVRGAKCRGAERRHEDS